LTQKKMPQTAWAGPTRLKPPAWIVFFLPWGKVVKFTLRPASSIGQNNRLSPDRLPQCQPTAVALLPPLRLTSFACMDMLGRNILFRKSRNRTEFARSRKSNHNGQLLWGVTALAV
jgi:hypothetical protein